MFSPNPSANRSVIEIDLDLAFKKKPTEPPVTTEPKDSPSSESLITPESVSPENEEIVPTSHEEPANDHHQDESTASDSEPASDEMPDLPEVEPAVEPTLPASGAPALRSADSSHENTVAPSTVTPQAERAIVSPPDTDGSMKAPSMRRDRRRQELQLPSKSPDHAVSASLPRTLPEMDAPPIREAITKEQADAAQRELEKKLLSVTKKPELTLPEMPTEELPGLPAKVADTAEPQRPVAGPSDDLASARNELHRLAKPVPVEDPSLELAAEELKQLAESEELQDAAATLPTPSPTQPGLKFARDAVSTKGVETPAPIQPVSNQITAKSTPALDAPPAMNLPPVNLDSPTLPEKKTSDTLPKKEKKVTSPPTSLKKEKTSASEPPLKPIPPAASMKSVETEKPVLLDVSPPSPSTSKPPIAEHKPKSNIPRLRREADPSTISSATPVPMTHEPKTAASTPSATANQPEQPINLSLPEATTTSTQPSPTPVPTTKPPTIAQKPNGTPPSWRPVMPTRHLSDEKPDEPTLELIQTSADLTAPVESTPSLPPETKEPVPVEPAKPRILAPIEADDLGTTSTRSILTPAGEKLVRVDFSRSLAARAVNTLVTSKARTARERALADLHRMDLWFKAEGSLDAIKQVALADDRLLMRQAAVEVLAATPTHEKQIDRVLSDIAATNSESSIRQQAREAISQRNRRGPSAGDSH
jgi:hypothetical protein